MTNPLRTTAVLAALLLAAAAPAAPALVPDPALTVAALTSSSIGGFEPPPIAAAADGSFLVTWTDEDRIYVRAFDAGSQPLGPPQLVSAPGTQAKGVLPQAAALPAGGYVVVWAEPTEFQVHDRVVARMVAPDGAPRAAPFAIGEIDHQWSWPGGPALAVERSGAVVVASSRSRRLLVQRFVPTAESLLPLGAPFDAGEGTYPSLATVPGGLVVAALRLPPRWWELRDPAHDPPGDSVIVRRFGPDGSPRGPEHVVTGAPFEESLAARVVADGSGRFLLVWFERGLLGGDWFDRIRAQRFAADGAPLGSAFDLVTGDPWPLEGPLPRALLLGGVAIRDDGSFLVDWSHGPWLHTCVGPPGPPFPPPLFPNAPGCGFFTAGEVFARVFHADGSPASEAVKLVDGPTASAMPAGAAAVAGGWVVLHHHRGEIAATRLRATDCGSDAAASALCIAGRFRVELAWATAEAAGSGHPIGLARDTGAFWFFSPGNLEMVVKVLDGTAVNGRHWVFFASLTDVELDLVVTDTATGVERRYHNPRGTMASRADVMAFPPALTVASLAGSPSNEASASLGDDSAAPLEPCGGPAVECRNHFLSLEGGRFTVTVDWRLPAGVGSAATTGAGTPVPLSDDTGLFWFFSPHNLELAVKVLDGTAVNGKHWVFFASLTDVELDLTVIDNATGARRTYRNPAGTMASHADVDAFP